MHFVKQPRRYARKFRITLDAVDEYAFGDDQYPRCRRLLAVEPGRVADRLADGLSGKLCDPLRRSPRGKAAWAQQ